MTIDEYQPTRDSQAQLTSLRHSEFPRIATGTPILNGQYARDSCNRKEEEAEVRGYTANKSAC